MGSRSWRLLQIRKAGGSSVFFIFFSHQYSSWMEMASQGSFNMNTNLIPMLRPGRELPGIFGKQTSPWKWQNVWNPSARFPLCRMRGAALTLPKPHLLSCHLKFIKCDSVITFTHTAFDLLSLHYHKAVQRRTSRRLLFCATVIAFLILGGEEYWYRSPDHDIIGGTLLCWERGGAPLRNKSRESVHW